MYELIPLIDEDTRAYNKVVAANGLPKGTPELDAAQRKAVAEANRLSIEGLFTFLLLLFFSFHNFLILHSSSSDHEGCKQGMGFNEEDCSSWKY